MRFQTHLNDLVMSKFVLFKCNQASTCIGHMFANKLVLVLNIIFDILKDPINFHKGCLIEITYHGNINTIKKFVLNVFYRPYPIIYNIKHFSTNKRYFIYHNKL
jgi:hypothetical protein